MHFAVLSTVVTILAGIVSAQTTHKVMVGNGGLTFNPPQVTAAVGDIVSFEFHPKNHTLTQSTFDNPCTPLAGGVDSKFMPVAAAATQFPVYSFRINEVVPLWFYCAQGAHCQAGMVMAINAAATGDKTYDNFLAKAKGATSGAVASGGTPTTASVIAAPSVSGGAGAVGGAARSSASASVDAAAAGGTGAAANGAMKIGSGVGGSLAALGLSITFAFLL